MVLLPEMMFVGAFPALRACPKAIRGACLISRPDELCGL